MTVDEIRARVAEIASIQSTLQTEQGRLIALFDAGHISAEDYLSMVNRALAAAMQRNRDVLGDEMFRAIFGEAGENPQGLIDRDVFLKSARRRPERDDGQA